MKLAAGLLPLVSILGLLFRGSARPARTGDDGGPPTLIGSHDSGPMAFPPPPVPHHDDADCGGHGAFDHCGPA
jgi:hypothetical protein